MLRDTEEKDELDPSHSINNAIKGYSTSSSSVFYKAKHKGSDTNEWRVI